MKFFHRRKRTQRLFYRTPDWFRAKFNFGKKVGKDVFGRFQNLRLRKRKERKFSRMKGGEKND